jgi:3-phosphoshikimate 1-carboxyvinyltransferase
MSHQDHRIALSCAIAAMGAEGVSTVNDIECVNKSYPDFVADMNTLGCEIEVLA